MLLKLELGTCPLLLTELFLHAFLSVVSRDWRSICALILKNLEVLRFFQ